MQTEPPRDPPSPYAWPLLGHTVPVARAGILPFIERGWAQHGDHFVLKFGNRRLHVLCHPDHAEHVLWKAADNYTKGPTYDEIRRLTGEGLLTLVGAPWRRRRKLMQPSFHRKRIAEFTEAMARCTDARLTSWQERFPQGGSFDLHAEMMRLTLEVVGETLFGQSVGENADTSGRMFGDALELLGGRGNSAVNLPLSLPTPGNRRLKRALAFLDAETRRVIEGARADGPKPTLLSMLLDARDEETGEALTDDELRNEVITLFLAGHETTALLLTWTFTLLRENPEVEQRLHEEVQTLLEGRTPTADDVMRLPYTRRVIDEVLRLRSPVWSLGRDCVADDTVRGFRIRAGEAVLPLTWAVHRHPDFWEAPLAFDPDRWLPERRKDQHRWCYFPFSLGERQCIGNVFSLTEATLILAMLSQRCRLAVQGEVPGEAAITWRPAGPVPTTLTWTR